MPRYFFDVHADIWHPDTDGSDLPDLEAAQAFAAGIIATMTDDARRPSSALRVVIRDVAGDTLDKVTWSPSGGK